MSSVEKLDAFHLFIFKQIFENPKFKQSFNTSLKARFPQTWKYINERYPQLNGHDFSEKCWWLMHNLEDFPRCKMCGRLLNGKYINIVKGYLSTCSLKCGNNYKRIKYEQWPYFNSSEQLDEIFRDMIEKLHLKLCSNSYVLKIRRELPYIYNYIFFRYDKLIGHHMSEKIYWFINKLYDFPKCVICGKDLHSFINAVKGYSIHCPKCTYVDPVCNQKISDSYHKHKSKDPNFLQSIIEKRKVTNVKNGHSSTWNNAKQAQQTRKQLDAIDPNRKNIRDQQSKQTRKQRYDDENWNNSDKRKQTCIKLYGVDSFSKTQEFIEKTKATNQMNFGADFVMQSELGVSRFIESMQNAHGVNWPSQTDEYKKKWLDEDFVEKRQQKIYATKRKNNTFKTSKQEDDSYIMLCQQFGENDIERQHKDEKYPFNCDFYIKSKDLYIECNFSWTHGGHWFDPVDEDDVKRVQQMRAKNSKYYDNAIETWTVRDINKRKYAEDNSLNYLVFWKIIELKRWLLLQSK